jgi:hypothetical protein
VCSFIDVLCATFFITLTEKKISRWLSMSGASLNIAKSMEKDNAVFWGSILVAEL